MKFRMLKRMVMLAIVGVLTGAMPAAAQQEYPSRPIKFISIASPGALADLVMRHLANKLNERLGWTVVVENRVSAEWIIPALHVVQSPPDGYTILEGLS